LFSEKRRGHISHINNVFFRYKNILNELRFVILEKNYTTELPDGGRYKLLIRFDGIQKNIGRIIDFIILLYYLY